MKNVDSTFLLFNHKKRKNVELKGKNVEPKGKNVEQKEKMSTYAKSLFDILT